MELPTKTVVGTVMTNLGLIKALEEKGIKFIATAVGDRYVLEEMLAGGHLLGGEQSGHIIMSKYANTGDGLLTALQLISKLKKSGKSASELASFMKRYPQVLINVSGVAKEKLASSQVIAKAVSDVQQRSSALKILESDLSGGYISRADIGASRKEVLAKARSYSALFAEATPVIYRPRLIISVGPPTPDALQRWISEGSNHLIIEPHSSAEVLCFNKQQKDSSDVAPFFTF